MKPTRRTQPYRRGDRHPGRSLSAMLKGAPVYLPNPQDTQRATAKTLATMLREMRRRAR